MKCKASSSSKEQDLTCGAMDNICLQSLLQAKTCISSYDKSLRIYFIFKQQLNKETNIIMKKIITSIVAVFSMLFIAGCRELTVERMTTISTVVGRTAGYACELSKTKTEVKEAIAKVLDIASTVVPTNSQTFVEAWTPVIDVELKKLVDAGKLTAADAQLAKVALGVACQGIDYIFIKYPKAKEGKDLVSAAVTGFVNGYKSVVTAAFRAGEKPEIDEEVLKYLKSKMTTSAK